MQAQRGMRDKLEKYLMLGAEFTVRLEARGKAVYDYCCFGVDADGKLSDDRYMVFYNQPRSPEGALNWAETGNGVVYRVQLGLLPASIDKLVFTASIDGTSTMREMAAFSLVIEQQGEEKLRLSLKGEDFTGEKAIIAAEIYRKETWRVNFVARGFNGGLAALLAHFGGELAAEEQGKPDVQAEPVREAAVQNSPKVSLEKKIKESAPQLVSLVKPFKVELEKRNLQGVIARVALVLDISGSMNGRYNDGTVQAIIDKTVPMAVQFDDDGEFDCWYYGNRVQRRPSVHMRNYKQAVPADWEKLMSHLGYGNYEPAVMQEVIKEYKDSDLPAYVIFITDGGVGAADEIKALLCKASRYPIFWQFVGVGGVSSKDRKKQGFFSRLLSTSYGILEELDHLEGRYIDNANFFALDDFKTVPNEELYSRLLNEFPQWMKSAKQKGILK